MPRVKRDFDQYLHLLYLMHKGHSSLAEMSEIMGCHRPQGLFLLNLLRDRYGVEILTERESKYITYHLKSYGIFNIAEVVKLVERHLKSNPANIRKD